MRISLRKAVRDLRRQRTQVAAVGLTVLLGVLMFVATGGAYRNLSTSYQGTYHRLGFADLVAVGTDPQALADAATSAGAATARVRTQVDQPMGLGGARLLGRLVGMPPGEHPSVDDVEVTQGQYLSPDDPDGVLLEKHAAATFGLGPGDTFEVATASGWHAVTVRGVVVSPEYLWPARSRQEVLGDPHSFAVVFAAQDQVQAWSGRAPDQALVLLGGASQTAVSAALRDAGASDVRTWSDNPSDAALTLDLNGFDTMSKAFPLMFLTAAAVAAYVLLTRRVLSERPTIGTLMAAGARRGRVVWHYVLQGLLIGGVAAVLGTALGAPLTVLITRVYTAELGIPDTVVTAHPDLTVIGIVLGVLVGALGAAVPAVLAARTVPAEAMRNQATLPAPGRWSGAVSRLHRLPVTTRMALRDVVRNPRRTLATMLGSVLGLVLVLASVGMMTSMIAALDTQYGTVQREDASVVVEPGAQEQVARQVSVLAGVASVESGVAARVTVGFGGSSYATDLQGLSPDTSMHGFVSGGRTVALPSDGVLAGAGLADRLGVAAGDTITVTDASGRTTDVRLAGLVDEPLGTLVYGTPATVESLVADPTPVLLVRFDSGLTTAQRDTLRADVTGLDHVLAYTDTRALLTMVDSYLGLFWAFFGVIVALGGVLALAVIQVTMSVNLVERTTELATLRASGVTVRKAAGVLATENLVAIVAGLPIGLAAGVLAAQGRWGCSAPTCSTSGCRSAGGCSCSQPSGSCSRRRPPRSRRRGRSGAWMSPGWCANGSPEPAAGVGPVPGGPWALPGGAPASMVEATPATSRVEPRGGGAMASGVRSVKTLISDQVVDARGRRRPGPVLAVKRSIPGAPVGGVLELIATDPTTLSEIPSWTAKVGQEYLGSFEDDGELHLFVRRLT